MGKGGRGPGWEQQPKQSGDRWNRGGRGGGGATPWAFAHVCDRADSLGLWALSQSIPDSWVDWNHGGKRKPDRMHATVLLKMTSPEHLPRLQSICQAAKAVHVTVGDLFCERVDRITDAEVYCIGIALKSEGLRALKLSWVSEEAEERRKVHVPYDSDGHISLAYIAGSHREDAQQFVAENRQLICDGRSFVLTEIAYQDEWRQETAIPLGGGATQASTSTSTSVGASGSSQSTARPAALDIDGSVLEGGGQILRMSSSYAALLGLPLRITKIRAGRSKPGLAAQHLESLRLVRDVSGGTLTNDRVGSQEVTLQPGKLGPGGFHADPGTAGAITLMIQAALCPLIFSGGASFAQLKGGTDVGFSPPLEYCRRVLLPSLRRMGAEFTLKCDRRGFYPKGGGAVQLDVPGLAPGQMLSAVDISVRGDVQTAEAILFVTQALGADEAAVASGVRAALRGLAPEIKLETSLVQAADPRSPKLWVEVVVQTSTGALFHGSAEPKDMFGGNKGGGKKGWGKGGGGGATSPADVAAACAAEAREPVDKQLRTGAAVDEHLIDQLILPASLASGRSHFLAAELSLHAQTAIHIAGICVPEAQFSQQQQGALTLVEVTGIGHTPSSAAADDSGGAALQPAKQPRTTAPATANTGGSNEEFLAVRRGGFSSGDPAFLQDLKTDMEHLSADKGAQVTVDVQGDRIVLKGGALERAAAKKELQQVLEWYRGNGLPI